MPGHDIGPILLCDGSQDGLLTALFYAESMRPRASAIWLERPAQASLLDEPVVIETEADKAARVMRAIHKQLPGDAPWVLESVHASCREDRGTVLMKYLRVGWQAGHRLNDHIAHPAVFEAMRISKQVGFETHKFTGLVRFRLLGGTFYCDFEPDNDILPFLAPHFADRLRDQNWILHDVGRDVAAIFDKACETWTILPLSARVSAGAEEDPFIALWLTYHKTISIKERENPKLQRQFMPRRYWKHLSEMKDKIRPG